MTREELYYTIINAYGAILELYKAIYEVVWQEYTPRSNKPKLFESLTKEEKCLMIELLSELNHLETIIGKVTVE